MAPIQLSISEIMYRDESNWIIDESFSRPKLLTSGLPTTSNHNSIILLVPHLMLCEHDCITMPEVLDAVNTIHQDDKFIITRHHDTLVSFGSFLPFQN